MARDLVWIKTFPDEAAADCWREALRARGIEAVVSGDGDDAGDTEWRLPARPRGFRLGVRANDVRAALDAVRGGPRDPASGRPAGPLTPP